MKPQQNKTTLMYFITAFIALFVFLFSMGMRATSLYDIYVTMQIFTELPFFAISVVIPFALFGLIRIFLVLSKETRYFYIVLLMTFFGSIIYEILTKTKTFRIFDIIAISVGLFIDMVLYEVYNKQLYGKKLNGTDGDYSTIQKKI